MKLQVDKHNRVPIYAQIVEQVERLVATGKLRPGDQLPTVRQMARDLGVNFNTVARAYAVLHSAGVISAQHGRGTFVRDRPDERSLARIWAEKLNSLAGRAVLEAFSLGYTSSEARSAFLNAIKQIEQESKR